jgi:predicted negative regulator of RcsB-dependent stress response
MESQDTATVYLFKAWPWVEANIKRIGFGAAFVAILIFLAAFFSWRQNQKEISAGQALTQSIISPNGQSADAFFKVAADYPGTLAGQRAFLEGAAALFVAGKLADAQAQFQKFLDTYPDSAFASRANLGVAACLDAQGQLDLAAAAYQRILNGSSDAPTVDAAKFATARIYEQQGKIPDALNLYADVVRANPYGSLGSEAALRARDLKSKAPAASTTASPAATTPFNLSH